ncbi:MAG: hypothetical protein U1F66_04825 [bacterium]
MACSGSATNPAPLVEIPSVVNIPKDVAIDVSEVSTASSGPTQKFLAEKIQTAQFTLANIIPIGPDVARSLNEDVLSGLLTPFNAIDIPVSPQVRTFQGTFQDPDALPQTFKFDFSDYDFNGDGVDDGFTGCTCPVGCQLDACPKAAPLADLKPVGFRVWRQMAPDQPFVPMMAGFFTQLPLKDDPATPGNEENPGAGSFRINVFDVPDVNLFERFLIGVVYNHRDPQNEHNLSTQVFLLNDFTQSDGTLLFSNRLDNSVVQLGKTTTTGENYLEKTVKSTFDGIETKAMGGDRDLISSQKYIGRFRDDQNFWSGSFFDKNPNTEVETVLPTTCARITTASEVEQGICIDLGIDTSGEAFLPATTEADVLLPSDFPPLPPFFLL